MGEFYPLHKCVRVITNEGRCSFSLACGDSNQQCLCSVRSSSILFKSKGHFSHLRCKLEMWPYQSVCNDSTSLSSRLQGHTVIHTNINHPLCLGSTAKQYYLTFKCSNQIKVNLKLEKHWWQYYNSPPLNK